MVETVRVKALRSFTEVIEGRGLVVFNAPRKADKDRGIESREGTEDDLPSAVAEDRVRRGYAEAIGKGAAIVNKSAAEKRRERTLAAREARRAQAISDGGALMGEVEGEPHTPIADDEAALREVQDSVANGDDLEAPLPTADGPGTQDASVPPSEAESDQEGELNTDTEGTGDGASQPSTPGRIVSGDDGLAFRAFDDDGDGKPGGSRKGAESTRSRGARRARRPASARTGGETAVDTDAPAE